MNSVHVAAMIALLHPQMSQHQRLVYGAELARDRDPAALVAIIEHESHFVASAQGGLDGACIGLAQRCLRFTSACRDGLETDSCIAERTRLLNGHEALRDLVANTARWRAFCRKTTGRSGLRFWLSGYAGLDGNGITCGQRRARGRWVPVKRSKIVLDIERIRNHLRGQQ